MKILVTTKRVPDTDQRIRVRKDGSGIDDAGLPFVINPFDAIALEEVLRIREAFDPSIAIVTVGIGSEDYEKELRTGLAMGADRALLVECNDVVDPWNAASILQEIVKREEPDLVLMGKQAVDDDANQAGQFLAALLDWPQVTFASKLRFVVDEIHIARETDAGVETVAITLPAVVTTDLRLNEPRYASLPSIMKARKKPIQRISLDMLGLEIEPRVRVLHVEAAATTRTCVRVANVDDLVDRLRNEVKVL